MDIQSFRQKYPQYGDLDDETLARSLHSKHYSDLKYEDFAKDFGVTGDDLSGLKTARDVTRAGLQGASLGFSDELGALISTAAGKATSALGLAPDTGESFRQEFGNALRNLREERQDFAEERPITNLATQVAGAIPTAGLAAGRALAAIPKTAGTLKRGAAIAGIGAVEGGLAGAGTADSGERLEGAKTGAAIGGVAAPVAAGLTSGAVSAVRARSTDKAISEAVPSRVQIEDRAREFYEEADRAGVVVGQGGTQRLSANLRSKAQSIDFNPSLHPRVAAALRELDQIEAGPTSLGDLEKQRRIFAIAGSSSDRDERRVAGILRDELDIQLQRLSPSDISAGNADEGLSSLRYARELWKRNAKARTLERAVEKAENQASGFENGLRIQFRQILQNDRAIRQFSPAEKAAIEAVAKGNKRDNTLRLLGKFGIDMRANTNAVGALLGSGAGAGLGGATAIGGPMGAVLLPVAASGARRAAEKATVSRAERSVNIALLGLDPKAVIRESMKGNNPLKAEDIADVFLINNRNDAQKLASQLNGLSGKRKELAAEVVSIIAAQQSARSEGE